MRRWRKDLRLLVRERLKPGDSDRQVVDFIVARYGEFVLLKPAFTLHTLLLWLATPARVRAGAAADLPRLPAATAAASEVAPKLSVDAGAPAEAPVAIARLMPKPPRAGTPRRAAIFPQNLTEI